MPRYEFVEGTSSKFWEIALEGSSFTTTFGRIGTDGQTSRKDYDSPDKAKKEYDKLVAEKVKKGYALVGGGAPAAAPAKPAAKAAPTKAAAPFDDEGDEEDAPPPKKAPAKAASSSKSSGGGARRFELVEGSSSKFWEIVLEGGSFTTRYGKIGTDGQTTSKDFGSADKAKHEYEKLVAEKVKKGYVET